MILINTKTYIVYSGVSKAEAARRMGISEKQIGRWIEGNGCPFEVFNNWTLYFTEIRLKQKKGFALKK